MRLIHLRPNMEIKFKEKPTVEQISSYCEKIEQFLSAHDVKVTVSLSEVAPVMTSMINGIETEREKLWIQGITISTPKIESLEVHLHRPGIDDTLTEQEIWHDALQIQDEIYGHLNLNPGPPSSGDPYWKLWNYIKK